MKLPAEAQANPRAEAGPSVDKPTCKGTTKAGNPCRSTVVGEDGYCLVHSPSRAFDPVETGRQGGKKSGVTRRALSKSDREQIREGRERLREQFESDPAFYEKVKTVYREALEAVTTCPGCHEHAVSALERLDELVAKSAASVDAPALGRARSVGAGVIGSVAGVALGAGVAVLRVRDGRDAGGADRRTDRTGCE